MQFKSLKRILSAVLAVVMFVALAPISTPQTVYALSDEDITATVELGKGFNLLAGKTFEAGNLQSAPIFKSMENMNPTKTRLGDVESKMTYITSMSSYLDNTHTDISVDVGVSTEILMAKTDIKAKFGFKGSWESEGSTNKSRLILEILAKAYKYSMNINQGDSWAKDENGNYITLNDKFAKDLMNMDPKAFFNTYGTHIVTQYDAGGEAYTSYEGTDTSNSMKSEFDIEANASVDVSTKTVAAVNVAVNTSGGEKHENSFANNNQQMSMRVRGGDPMYSTFDAIISGDADDAVNGWLASMYGMDENTGSTKSTMIKSDNMQLFAMWDLLAMDKSQSNTARIEELKKYYMDNVKEEIVDMYQEFIYGIPTNFADEYAQINAEIVTNKELGSVDTIPEGFLAVRTEDDLMRMNGNKNYILLNDIEITDDFIHAAVDYDEFRGVFDGNGHTISGLKLIDTKGKYVGLFPLINSGAVIKNLTIKDAEVVVESKEGQTVYAGILCGANTEGLTGSDLGKIMDVRIEDSSITIKGGAGTTYLGGIVGYTDSRSDNNNDRALQRATVKNCVIKNERAGADNSVGGITGYHKGQGGWAMLRVASYDNEISTAEGYAGGVIGRSAYQRGSYVISAGNSPANGYIGYLENAEHSSNATYEKIFTIGEEDFALGTEIEIFEECDKYLTADDEAPVWGYSKGEWDELPEPVFNTLYPYLIVHAPGGITAYKDATLGTNDITVYYAADPADSATYEDVTDYVNFFYDFSEVGTTTVAAVYGNKTIEFEVEVLEPVVTKANIINAGKTEYKISDVFSLDDFVGQIVYSNTFTENVSVANDEFVVTIPELEGNTPVVSGEYIFEELIDCTDVVVRYNDVEFVYEISVAEAEDTGAKINFTANYIPVSADSFKYDIYINDNLGIVALKATLEYDESAYTLKNIIDKETLVGYSDSTEMDESGENVIYESPIEIFWSDAQTTENNTFNGVILTLEFEYTGGRQSADFYDDKLIKFMFNGAYDVTGNPVGGRNGIFDIADSKVKVGDVNADEKVSIWDAVLLKKSTYNDNYDNLFLSAADVNFDYAVNTLDSLFLNRHIVGQYGLPGTPGTYNVTFKGSGFDTYESEMSVGDVLLEPTHPDKFTFEGWYDNPAFQGDPITHISAVTGSNLTFWAKMLCPVSYFSLMNFEGSDALPRTHSISPENPFDLSEYEISADNYDFLYWTYKFDGTDDQYERVPEGGITEIKGNGALFLVPVFSDVKEYNVYVVVEVPGLITTTVDRGTYVPGRTIFVPASGTPMCEGYIKGTDLYLDADYTDGPYTSGDRYTTDATKKEDLYFYFKYEPVKFNINIDWGVEGVEDQTLQYVYGNELKLPEPPSRIGYTFNGWTSTHEASNGIVYDEDIIGDSLPKQWLPYKYVDGMDVTLTAQWSNVSNVKLTLIDGLTFSSSVYTINPTKDYTLPAGSTNLVLVNGVYYQFDGWYDNKEYTGSPVTVIPANTFNPIKSKYYSKWTAVPNTAEEN